MTSSTAIRPSAIIYHTSNFPLYLTFTYKTCEPQSFPHPQSPPRLSKFISYHSPPCSLWFGHTCHTKHSKHAHILGLLPVPSFCNAFHLDILISGTLISFRSLTKYQFIREDSPNHCIWNRNQSSRIILKNILNSAWLFYRVINHPLFLEKFWLFCGNW